MKDRNMFFKSLLCGGILALATPMAHADTACDAEAATIQSVLSSPSPEVSSSNLTQAQNLFKILSEDCAGGSPLDSVLSIAQQIRSLLNMGES